MSLRNHSSWTPVGSTFRSPLWAGLAVALLLGLCWLVTFVTGGAGRIPPHWFYAPIFVAAFRFGAPGAAFAAIAAGFLAGPLMPLDVESGTPQALSDWGGRAAFFLAIGLFMTSVMARHRGAEERRDSLAGQLDRRTAELEAVRVVSESVGASLDIDRVLTAALERSLHVTGFDLGWVSLLDETTGELRLAAGRNVSEELRTAITSPMPGGWFSRVAAERRPRIIRDVNPELPLRDGEQPEAPDSRTAALVVAPMESEGRFIGILALGALDGRTPDRDDLALVVALARPAAAAVANAGLYGALRQLEEQRRDLLARLVRAEEEERRRIAADIHDDPIQVITAAGMRLDLLRRSLSDPKSLSLADKAREAVSAAVARLRSMLFQLHPPTLDREGLTAALRALPSQMEEEAGFRVLLEVRTDAEPDPEARIVLYRIVQEALANVRKHARASSVDVVLEKREGGFVVRVEDDGVGFGPEEEGDPLPGHLGLPGMQERAELAGGWCRVQSVPGTGTTVEAWVPAGSTTEAA